MLDQNLQSAQDHPKSYVKVISFILIIASSFFVAIGSFSYIEGDFFSKDVSKSANLVKIKNLSDFNSLAQSSKLEYSSLSDDDQYTLFELFLVSYGTIYNSTDRKDMYKNFKKTLSRIDERNTAESKAGGSGIHGITKFSAYSESDFKASYLNAAPISEASKAITVDVDPYTGNEEVVTWEGVLVEGITDQGYCGSCWAISVVEQIEADGIRLGLYDLNMSLSIQQLVSCDDASFGCAGGWTERAYQYIMRTGGVSLYKDYPYTSYYDVVGTCFDDQHDFFVNIDGYYLLKNEQAMIDYVKSTGPLSVCIDASAWASYIQGVVTACDNDVNHCVQIIGIDTSPDNGYWLIRNSWGTEWGENGYIRLSVGSDTCAISTDPTYVKPFLL